MSEYIIIITDCDVAIYYWHHSDFVLYWSILDHPALLSMEKKFQNYQSYRRKTDHH